MRKLLFSSKKVALLMLVSALALANDENSVDHLAENSQPSALRKSGFLGLGRKDDIHLPTLLTPQLYKRDKVCDHARANARGKKFALILAKTHHCDESARVCLMSLQGVLDPANKYIQNNFVIYHTRTAQTTEENQDAIRREWKKDTNPEFVIMDLKNCKITAREYLAAVPDSLARATRGQDEHSRRRTQMYAMSDLIEKLMKNTNGLEHNFDPEQMSADVEATKVVDLDALQKAAIKQAIEQKIYQTPQK